MKYQVVDSPIFGVISQLFSTIFGRRLGTTDDGTTLRSNPELGVDPDFDDSTSEHFTDNTRDITLRRIYTIKLSQKVHYIILLLEVLIIY